MVDEAGQSKKSPSQETIFNSDIGDDWGEAFEAEDFMAAPKEEAAAEFFLPDIPEESLANIQIAVESHATAAAAPAPGGIALLVSRFRQTSLSVRLALFLVPLLGLTLPFAIHRFRKPAVTAPQAVQTGKEAAHAPQEAPATPTPTTLAPPPVEATHEPKAPAATHEGSHQAKAEKPALLRKKWRFSGVVIHAKTEKDQPKLILATDLTLVLKLSPEAIPPAERESFVREVLYQFYTNQPPADLRRYALERSELNRKLLSWVLKQWPELPLETITIDRYQIL